MKEPEFRCDNFRELLEVDPDTVTDRGKQLMNIHIITCSHCQEYAAFYLIQDGRLAINPTKNRIKRLNHIRKRAYIIGQELAKREE
jgi:hypothetical protein